MIMREINLDNVVSRKLNESAAIGSSVASLFASNLLQSVNDSKSN